MRGAASTQNYADTDLQPLLLVLHYFSILILVFHPSPTVDIKYFCQNIASFSLHSTAQSNKEMRHFATFARASWDANGAAVRLGFGMRNEAPQSFGNSRQFGERMHLAKAGREERERQFGRSSPDLSLFLRIT